MSSNEKYKPRVSNEYFSEHFVEVLLGVRVHRWNAVIEVGVNTVVGPPLCRTTQGLPGYEHDRLVVVG